MALWEYCEYKAGETNDAKFLKCGAGMSETLEKQLDHGFFAVGSYVGIGLKYVRATENYHNVPDQYSIYDHCNKQHPTLMCRPVQRMWFELRLVSTGTAWTVVARKDDIPYSFEVEMKDMAPTTTLSKLKSTLVTKMVKAELASRNTLITFVNLIGGPSTQLKTMLQHQAQNMKDAKAVQKTPKKTQKIVKKPSK